MKFDLPKEQTSIIKVIGVGGGGSNAVNHMFKQGIKGVDFIICNTDQQALDISPVPIKVALGASLTEGRGAGSMPEVGKNAAIENIEDIRNILAKNTKMVFITAGMGGGTGTGAAPVIAKTAKEMGILTVGIVTIPFAFEGKKRRAQAEEGLEEMKACVDTLLVISNDKLREIYGNLKVTEAFGHADDVLTTAAKGIADIITTTLQVNTDFADIKTVMRDSGVAIMGSAVAEGDNRAIKAVEAAMHSPLLNDSNITGARYVLLNITCGTNEITMDELGEITDYIQEAAGQTAELIKGYGIDETLGDKINITIIATGFKSGADAGIEITRKVEKIVHKLVPDNKVETPVAKKEEPKVVTPAVEEEKAPEPFLIIRKPEPQPEVKPVAKVEEVKAEVKAEVKPEPKEEVKPVVNTEPVAKVEEVKPVEPVAEVPVTPVVNITPVSETPVEPVSNDNVEFEITNLAEDTTADTEETFVSEEEITIEAVEETRVEEKKEEIVQEPVMEIKKEEPVIEVKKEEPVIEPKKEEPVMEIKSRMEPVSENKPAPEPKKEPVVAKSQSDEQIKKAQERIAKLKELSMKLKTPNGLTELEKEPAYKRKNITLESTPHSSESQISRFTLTETEEKKVEIRPNNSFLHDNVD